MDKELQVTTNSVIGGKAVREVLLPPDPRVDGMHSGAKDLRACGSLWEILLRPLLPTGLLLSRLREHKPCTLL